jgi:spore germination protein YaaH
MKRITLALAGLLALVASLPAGTAKISQKGNFGIAGWLVYWDPKSMDSYERNAGLIDRVYPEWYIIGEDGLPLSNEFAYKEGPDREAFFAKKQKTKDIAKKHGIQIFSMIVNFDNKVMTHSAERVHKFLYNPAVWKKHIQLLVDNAVRDGAHGIDIDYENMKAADAQPFCEFMAELRKACDAKGLLLATAIAPKSDHDGTWDGNQAHDYRCLGPSVHLLRPMTYDEHWGTSTAGPVSSPEFSELVTRYSTSVTDPQTVELGFAGYGYDWKGKKGDTIVWDDILAYQKKGIKITRDEETQELTGRYQDEKGEWREFWFCDAYSYRPKYQIMRKYKMAGMAMWRFGSEDPRMWEDIKAYKFAKDW